MKAEDKAASRAKTMSIYGEMVPEASGRKPGMGRLDEFSRSNLRQPRTNSKGEDDSPVGNVTSGSLTVALGLSVIGFASRSLKRVSLEKRIIEKMWSANTTVASLMRMPDPLPKNVLLRGRLGATGPPVVPLTTQIQQLQPHLGQIDQPNNVLIEIGQKFKKALRSGQFAAEMAGQGNVTGAAFAAVQNLAKSAPDEALAAEDYRRREPMLQSCEMLVTELLVTRLSCEARKTVTEDKKGNKTVKITRNPRRARFNVKHVRQVADGLFLRGMEGEKANLKLPEYDVASEKSPSLFLTLPDAMHEFKTFHALTSLAFIKILNANMPFTHLSKFIFIDQRSVTDAGGFQKPTDEKAIAASSVDSALDALGRLSPHGWHWNGKGFYDNNPGGWSKWNKKAVLDYKDFARRIPEAAELNARHQVATRESPAKMRKNRDNDNCFRVVELGIPTTSDVTVLGSPSRKKDGSITIMPPAKASSIDETRFEFRILKGHTIQNLIKHRQGSLQVYFGLACMGLFTVLAGEELIRDNLVVQYVS